MPAVPNRWASNKDAARLKAVSKTGLIPVLPKQAQNVFDVGHGDVHAGHIKIDHQQKDRWPRQQISAA